MQVAEVGSGLFFVSAYSPIAGGAHGGSPRQPPLQSLRVTVKIRGWGGGGGVHIG